jgi:hypothetical protein
MSNFDESEKEIGGHRVALAVDVLAWLFIAILPISALCVPFELRHHHEGAPIVTLIIVLIDAVPWIFGVFWIFWRHPYLPKSESFIRVMNVLSVIFLAALPIGFLIAPFDIANLAKIPLSITIILLDAFPFLLGLIWFAYHFPAIGLRLGALRSKNPVLYPASLIALGIGLAALYLTYLYLCTDLLQNHR